LLSICLPASQSLLVFSLSQKEDRTTEVSLQKEMPACAATSLRATRKNVWDLLVVKPLGELSLLTHGLCDLPITVRHASELDNNEMDLDQSLFSEPEDHGIIVSVQEAQWGTTIVTYKDGWKSRITLDIYAQDVLVTECFQLLALIIPADVSFALHRAFLENWSAQWWSTAENVEFKCFTSALYAVFGLDAEDISVPSNPWLQLAQSSSHTRFREDPALRFLRTPPSLPSPRPVRTVLKFPNPLLCPLLYGLHMLGEHLRLLVHRHSDLLRFAPVLCRIALAIRPEWADYWKRLVPDAISAWPSPITSGMFWFPLHCAAA
jgi:anaphase-promoting complex subunit 1